MSPSAGGSPRLVSRADTWEARAGATILMDDPVDRSLQACSKGTRRMFRCQKARNKVDLHLRAFGVVNYLVCF